MKLESNRFVQTRRSVHAFFSLFTNVCYELQIIEEPARIKPLANLEKLLEII